MNPSDNVCLPEVEREIIIRELVPRVYTTINV